MNSKKWLIFALLTTFCWGLWGALTGAFSDDSIPSTFVYAIWALTMIPPCLIALKLVGWQLQVDKRSIFLGSIIGFLGSGGQMLLFHTVTVGPAYLIFPIISLSPLITIFLSFSLLKERTGKFGALGIALALIALPLFEYSPASETDSDSVLWFVFALGVMAAWGVQAYFMKFSNEVMSAESIFFYMTVTGLLLIPVAYFMTEPNSQINLTWAIAWQTAAIQVLNAVGALCLVYAFRYGKAIVVSPLTNAGAPLISSVLLIVMLGIAPSGVKILAIALALIAALILAIEPDEKKAAQSGV